MLESFERIGFRNLLAIYVGFYLDLRLDLIYCAFIFVLFSNATLVICIEKFPVFMIILLVQLLQKVNIPLIDLYLFILHSWICFHISFDWRALHHKVDSFFLVFLIVLTFFAILMGCLRTRSQTGYILNLLLTNFVHLRTTHWYYGRVVVSSCTIKSLLCNRDFIILNT